MKKFSEWWVRRSLVKKSRSRLTEITARLDELELLLWQRRWGKQSNNTDRRDWAQALTPDHPWDRQDHEFLKDSEKVEMDQLAEEHFILSQFLSENGQGSQEFFRPKMHGGVLLGENSPKAYMTVKHDRSTKISYEYVELVDLMVKTVNGKWSSHKYDWSDVEMFKKQGWGRPAEFNEYRKRYHDAKTPEESEAVLNEYRSKYPNAIY